MKLVIANLKVVIVAAALLVLCSGVAKGAQQRVQGTEVVSATNGVAVDLSNRVSGGTVFRSLDKRLPEVVLHIKDFGGQSDGVTVDNSAATNLAGHAFPGATLDFGTNTLLTAPGGTNFLITFRQLQGVNILGSITNNQLGMSASDWVAITSLQATGQLVYATCGIAHGLTAGNVVTVYSSVASEYGGAVTILTNSFDATHFAYNTLGGTNANTNVTTGTIQVAKVDYESGIFRFVQCTNTWNRANFEGQFVWTGVRQRRGIVFARYDNDGGAGDNEGGGLRSRVKGASYALWAGYYAGGLGHWRNPYIDLDAENVGYGMASWGALEGLSGRLRVKDAHRFIYAGGARHWSWFDIGGTGFDVTKLLFTTAIDGSGNQWGAEDNIVHISERGTRTTTSYFSGAARYLGLYAQELPGTAVATHRNNTMFIDHYVDQTMGTNIVTWGISDAGNTNLIFENCKVVATINRSGVSDVTGMGPSYEMFARADGPIRGMTLDFNVINSSVTATNANFKRDIQFGNNVGTVMQRGSSDSQKAVTITGGRRWNEERISSLAASPTITRLYDDSNVLQASLGGGAFFPAVTLDLGSSPQRWRDGYFSGIVTANHLQSANRLTSLGAVQWRRVIQSADYTITTNDHHVTFSASAIATLPSASLGTNEFVIVTKTGATVTVNPSGGDTINENSSATVTPLTSLRLISDGTGNWEATAAFGSSGGGGGGGSSSGATVFQINSTTVNGVRTNFGNMTGEPIIAVSGTTNASVSFTNFPPEITLSGPITYLTINDLPSSNNIHKDFRITLINPSTYSLVILNTNLSLWPYATLSAPPNGYSELKVVWRAGTAYLFNDWETVEQRDIWLSGRMFSVCDGAGSYPHNTNNYASSDFLSPYFSNSGATNANYCDARYAFPANFWTNDPVKVQFHDTLTGSDTGTRSYTLQLASVASGSSIDSPTFGTGLSIAMAADGSGSAGKVEVGSLTTWTGANTAIVPGNALVIRAARDGAGSIAGDTSTTDTRFYGLRLRASFVIRNRD